jgi:hypothetical protein
MKNVKSSRSKGQMQLSITSDEVLGLYPVKHIFSSQKQAAYYILHRLETQ